MNDYYDPIEVQRDAEAEELAAHLGRVLDDMEAEGDPMIEDEEVCAVCGEGDGEFDDVVANFWDAAHDVAALAHYDCGMTQGWTLA